MTAAAAPVRHTAASGRIARVLSPGGIEAWLVEDHTVPLIALEFSFAAGTIHDAPGKSGTASMLAALLDEGAGPLDAGAFQEALAEHAIELHFSAGRDWFHGSLKTLARHRDEAVRLTRLAVNEARLDAEPIERIRAEMVAGLRYEANEPDVVASRRFFELAFGEHPYALAPQGSLASIGALTREDLEGYRRAALTREKLIVTCVGAISAADLSPILDDLFAGLPARGGLGAVGLATLAGAGAVDVTDIDVPQTTLVFGAPGLTRSDPDFIAAAVVNHILGEGSFTSRLWQEVREKRGLAYSVRSWLHPLKRGPLFYGSTSTKNERAQEALDIIRDEVRRMGADGPGEIELEQAKRYMIGSYALRFDTSTKIADELTGIAFDGLGIDYVDRRNDLIAAVTLDDARRVAKRLYGEGDLLVAAAGRPGALR